MAASKRAALLPKTKLDAAQTTAQALQQLFRDEVPLAASYFATLSARLHCVMSFKRMGFLDAARSYPALLSVRSPVPELKDHVRSVSQRDSRGYPFTVSTIIATPIPEMAECGSRNGHRHALDLWRPKYVITLVPPVAQRACTALGSRRQRSAPTLITQPQ